jgi:transcriptional regulator with XRE-family HTH domain
MSLAQRVRDIRYAKGWGPDELANRAEISRTALYQIESGKTGLPRAGTLRRIAVALEVPMEDLLGFDDEIESSASHHPERAEPRRPRILYDWAPGEGGALALPNVAGVRSISMATAEESRFAVEADNPAKTNGHEAMYLREGELMSKLHDLLHSPIGNGVVRIVEELHGMLPRSRTSI